MMTTSSKSFQNKKELGDWLAENNAGANEIWVRIYKAASGKPSVTWTDCVIEALRFGWIDGQKKPLDESSFLQRISPRKPKSNWSSKNRELAERLIAEGRMAPAGLAHVEAARKDGRWEKTYASSAKMEIPEDFLEALDKKPIAKSFFATLNRQNLFSIYYRLHTARKPETRAKRMAEILLRLERKEKLR